MANRIDPGELDAATAANGLVTRCPDCASPWAEWHPDGDDRPSLKPRRLVDPVRPALTCERGHRYPIDLLARGAGESTDDVLCRVGAAMTRGAGPTTRYELLGMPLPAGLGQVLARMEAEDREQTHRLARRLAARREAEARRLVLCSLRPRLRWLIAYPRLLDWAYRLRLAERPTMTVASLL